MLQEEKGLDKFGYVQWSGVDTAYSQYAIQRFENLRFVVGFLILRAIERFGTEEIVAD